MTESEIMKALAYCKNQGLTSECTECPYKGTKRDCMGVMLEDAIDLINRKNAEIERFKELLEEWKTEAYKIADEKDELYCDSVDRVKTARAEAIKEVVKRVKEKAYLENGVNGFREMVVDLEDINQIADEIEREQETK